MKNDYTIGLDIGTNSVGWSVIKDDLTLVRKRMKVKGNTDIHHKKKNFWGSRLFDAGETAESTRLKRQARRRYERRRFRLKLLQGFFAQEMDAIDSDFFQRLTDSFLIPEEKSSDAHPVFGSLEEEVAYHDNYPTIYHLRKALADSEEQFDLRLVYLALAHIVKYRGNFLVEGKLDLNNVSIVDTFRAFIEKYNEIFAPLDQNVDWTESQVAEVDQLLRQKVSRTKKFERIIDQFEAVKKSDTFALFIKLIVGNNADFKKAFDLEEKAPLNLSKETYEEDLEALLAIIGEDYRELFLRAKAVYDAMELAQILSASDHQTNAKLSAQMIAFYDQHGEDLAKYKAFVRHHLPKKYKETFNDSSKNGYAGYIDGKASQEDFYKFVGKQIKGIDGAEYFEDLMDRELFLRKQRSFYNGVIPHQVHLAEMRAIIDQQSQFYPFLKEYQDKMESLVTFRIPYYVGPLAKNKDQSEFSWLSRKSDDALMPWNFSELVDLDQSAVKFIENLTNYDTYLPDEKVLPKRSLLYQKYTIYNELTKVSYTDERGEKHNFSGEEKQEIFNGLFKQHANVSEKQLIKFLENNYHMDSPIIEGIDSKFNANYSTYYDLAKIPGMRNLLDDPQYDAILEEIVKIITVFEDRKMCQRQLEQFNDILDSKTIKALSRKHYTGWGRLSAKLINGIRDEASQKTILDFLIEDDGSPRHPNRNLMQLINDENLSFKDTIKEHQVVDLDQSFADIVADLPGSPAIKKGILQSLKIVEEVVAIMGYAPKNIVVEMARENQTTDYGRRQSRQRLNKLQDVVKELGSTILKDYPVEKNEDLRKDRLYLYYLQNGRDMYTGAELDYNQLSNYDIDHIIPRSFTTDNSIDNKVLTASSDNRGKSDDVPSSTVVNKQKGVWQRLLRAGAISQRKYDNLTKIERGGLTEGDKAHFLKRQLVETRQITKHVANILDERFNGKEENNEKETKIILLKSSLASQFRKEFSLFKVREVNDYHHAHDAYLNAVIGTKLLAMYPNLSDEFVYGNYRYQSKRIANRATAKKIQMTNLMKGFTEDRISDEESGEVFWNKAQDIKTIKQVLSSKQINIVKKVEENTGQLYKETIQPKGDSDKLIPIANHLNPKYYGGFIEESKAYFVIVKHKKGKKGQINYTGFGVTHLDRQAFEENPKSYLVAVGFQSPEVIQKLKFYSLLEFSNGEQRLITGASKATTNGGELQKANQMALPQHLTNFVYHLHHYDEIESPKSFEIVNANLSMFDDLLTLILDFADQYIDADANVAKIKAAYDKYQITDVKSVKELAESFISLFTLTAAGAPSDFNFLGQKIPRKRYTSVNRLEEAEIIYQSITGLYETRVELGEDSWDGGQ
ncbi:type II CRISPR RNA-guided endonuclease Cas9 [Aerococcus kribbianus]|uniref:CRISPR-associated endonuclease Cas9 n=1 Tax=Aerococcus kribbianus TaxID=2999064 RepID=A0A9X3FNB6_9LACT|nr:MULTISPECIES: type II CRISPR RNA-guided endonuclease Cas9 [unclassified Aerococcus]MCZ0717429.1 type II CRISPR RNA-guided endonuclease Cas9 [Aerococcus sp. YH-aer221]MCZ0725717.1 type II CRISPR RNA-guided endonuclease Cas9 [Aerococcus sp. YH-aer222]